MSIRSSVLLLMVVQIEVCQMVLPTVSRQMGDHSGIVEEEPPGLQCLTKILATCVVEDVSKDLDILTLEASVVLERL